MPNQIELLIEKIRDLEAELEIALAQRAEELRLRDLREPKTSVYALSLPTDPDRNPYPSTHTSNSPRLRASRWCDEEGLGWIELAGHSIMLSSLAWSGLARCVPCVGCIAWGVRLVGGRMGKAS